MILIGNELSS